MHPGGTAWLQVAWPNIAQQPPITAGTPRIMGFTGGGGRALEGAWVERHQQTLNSVFADGHAKAMGLDTVVERVPAGQATANAYKWFTIEDD